MVRCAVTLRLATVCAGLALAACSGGGGSSSPLPATPASAVTAPPVTPASPSSTIVATGFVYDLPNLGNTEDPGWSNLGSGVSAVPGAAIAGADVYVGTALVLGATAPATVPAFVSHTTTAANGSFSIAGFLPGHYALTIFAPAPHTAVIHRDLILAANSVSATYLMAAPSAAEAAWLAQQTNDRSQYGANALELDESALEASRYWANFMAVNQYFAHCVPASSCEAGDTTAPPAAYGPQDASPQTRFEYFYGFSGAGEGENIAAGFATWQSVDSAFMQEVQNCPNDSPTNCTFGESTGHFLNIIDPQYAWTGVGIANASNGTAYYDEEFSLLSSSLPTSARVRSLHPEVAGLKH